MRRNTCFYDQAKKKYIKGILIGETEYTISQYADDTEIMLEGDKNSLIWRNS